MASQLSITLQETLFAGGKNFLGLKQFILKFYAKEQYLDTYWETGYGRPSFFFLDNTITFSKCLKWAVLLRRLEGIYIPSKKIVTFSGVLINYNSLCSLDTVCCAISTVTRLLYLAESVVLESSINLFVPWHEKTFADIMITNGKLNITIIATVWNHLRTKIKTWAFKCRWEFSLLVLDLFEGKVEFFLKEMILAVLPETY